MGDARDRLKQMSTGQATIAKENGLKIEYTGPAKCAEVACKYFPENRENVVVFDVAVGIGLTAIEMQKKGFRIFDGAEKSHWMLEKANATHIYRNLACKHITNQRTCSRDDTYDLVTACGSCERLPYNFIIEMIRVTKPGGIICIVNRRSTIYELPEYVENFFPLCDELETEGKWTKEEISTFPGFLMNEDGIIIVYRVN